MFDSSWASLRKKKTSDTLVPCVFQNLTCVRFGSSGRCRQYVSVISAPGSRLGVVQIELDTIIAKMLVDLDRLLARPIFDSGRCGISFHPLHSYCAIGIYFLLVLVPNTYAMGNCSRATILYVY